MRRTRRRIGRVGTPEPADRREITIAILAGLQRHGVRQVEVGQVLGWLTDDPYAGTAAAELAAPPDPRRDPMTGCLPVTAENPGP